MHDALVPNILSKKAVKKAGEILRSQTATEAELDFATKIYSQWRALHSYPLNIFQMLLRRKVKQGKFASPLIAQRLKRMPSIVTKLQRFPAMQLDRMQDIGGVRIILKNLKDVYKLHQSLIEPSRSKHTPELPPKDYIQSPKSDGYRSLHQVFKFTSNEYPELNGLRIELQIRTHLQHSWATAVETLGIIEKSSFKTGEGSDAFKEFFRLSSALFSLEENTPLLSEYAAMETAQIRKRIVNLEQELQILSKLTSLAASAKQIESTSADYSGYHLMELDSEHGTISLIAFTEKQLGAAEALYTAREQATRTIPTISVVLISAGNVKEIKKAYPNYFLDTKLFARNLKRICGMAE